MIHAEIEYTRQHVTRTLIMSKCRGAGSKNVTCVKHLPLVNGKHQCRVCERAFEELDHLLLHIAAEHMTPLLASATIVLE